MGLFDRLKEGLKKTRDGINASIERTLISFGKIDDELFEELEETLIRSDVGVDTTSAIISGLKKRVIASKAIDPAQVKQLLKDEITEALSINATSVYQLNDELKIIMVIGVNGAGKTTSIGKMAKQFSDAGNKVVIAAADTFRAAAIEQLQIWSDRAGATLVKSSQGADPASVIYDALHVAKAKGARVLICDTAGRLHNKKNLMDELSKMFRIIHREIPNAKPEVLLVLDATVGQNAVNQAKSFHDIAEITGIVLTKLDGTAKGGIVISIVSGLNIPVKLIGIGEGIDDLQEFNPELFAAALLD